MLSSLAAIPSHSLLQTAILLPPYGTVVRRANKQNSKQVQLWNKYVQRQTYEKNKTKIVSQAKGHCNIDVVKMRIYRNPNSICFLWYSSSNAVRKPDVLCYVPFAFGIYDSGPERYPLTSVTVINVYLNVAASTFHDTASRLTVIGKLGMPKRWQLANNAPLGLARRGDPARRRSARNSHCLAFAVAGYRLFGARRENRLISGARPMGKLAKAVGT